MSRNSSSESEDLVHDSFVSPGIPSNSLTTDADYFQFINVNHFQFKLDGAALAYQSITVKKSMRHK